MAFDTATLTQARESGYSDDEIVSHLAQSDGRFKQARDAGYQLDEIAKHFDPTPAESKPDTFSDDWTGFVANMQIAGNRMLQGLSAGALEAAGQRQQLAQKARSAFESYSSEDLNAPQEELPAPIRMARKIALSGGNRRPFEQYKEQLKSEADTQESTWKKIATEIPEFASYLAQKEKRIQELTPSLSPEMQKLNESKGAEFWKTFASNPVESLANVIASSAIVSAPAIAAGAVGSLAGPAGTAAATATGSYSVETSQAILDALKSADVDIANPEQVEAAFTDPAVMEKARDFANKRGVPIAIFDAATAGIAGRFIGPVLKEVVTPTTKAVLAATGKEVLTQAAGGAAGEFTAQVAAGQEISLKDITLEALGEIGTGVTEVTGNIRARNKVDAELAKIGTSEPPPLSTPSEPIKTIPTTQETQPTATPDAITNPETAPVYGDVRQEPGEVPQQVPAEEGGERVPSGGQAQPPVQEEKVSPHPPQTKGESIISTGILGEDGKPLVGQQWNSPHADIIKQNPELALIDDIENRKGFIIQDANGRQRFVGRKQALEVGQKAGQVDIAKVYDPEGHGLISEALVPIEPSPKSTGVINAEQAAQTLQPFLTQAVDAARQAGAIDPESAASQAQIELSKQVSEGTTKLDNPQAIFLEAARRQARKQQEKEGAQKRGGKVTEPIETALEPSVTRGPRADIVSEEDIQSIDAKIDTLPEQQKRVMRALTEDPDLTDLELAEQTGMTEGAVKQAKARARQTLRDFISKQGIGANLGPGAANIEEVLTQYEKRKFGKRFQETEEIAPEIKKETGDRYYEIIPNQVTAERATELIETHGTEQIEDNIRDEKSDLSFADRVTVGQILIKQYNEQFKAEKNPEQARKILDRASSLAEWAADFGTKLGQGVQAFAMWMRLTAQGKLRTFEKLVKAKRDNFTRDNRSDIDEIKDVVNGEGTPAEKVRKLRKLKNPTAKKVKSRVGRIVQAAKDGKLTDEKFYEASGDALGLPVFSPEVAAEIQRLAALVDSAPEGMPKMEAMRELNTYIAKQKGYDPTDLLFGIYYGNILSGTGTHLVNLVDTVVNVVNEVGVLALQNPRAAAHIAASLGRGAARGGFDSVMAFLKGRRLTDGKFAENPFFMETAEFGKKGGVPIKTATRFGRAAKAVTELPIASPLRAWKYVGRIMSATDALAFRAAQEAKSAQLAWQIANDPQSTQTIDHILGYDRMAEFQKQAESEGYTSYQKQARATELMLMSRPEELQKAATDFASEGTYNVKPYGVIGTISNSIESASRKVPPLKLIVPFTRIVGNVLNRGINNSPWGYVRALRGKAGLETDPLTLKKYSAEERNALMVRAHISMAMITTLAALHATGVIIVHGGGPSDPEKKRQLRQTGWKPYTVQVGDGYYSTTYTPWGIVLAAMGNYFDSQKYQDLSAKSALDKATYVLLSVAGSLFNQSFLTGLSNFFDILSEKTPGEQASAARRFAAQTTSSAFVPLSSLAKDVESWVSEPNIPKASTLSEALISNIPFASQGLRPQLNALGEPMKSNRSRFISDRTDDPVWRMISDKGLRIPVPNVFFDDPDSQYEYVQEQGKLLRKWIEANMGRLKNAESKQAQVMIENASDSFRERSRNKLILKGAKKKQKPLASTR